MEHSKHFYAQLIDAAFDGSHGMIVENPVQAVRRSHRNDAVQKAMFWSTSPSGTVYTVTQEGGEKPTPSPDILRVLHDEQLMAYDEDDGSAEKVAELLRMQWKQALPRNKVDIETFINLCDSIAEHLVKRVCVQGDDRQVLEIAERVMQALRRAYAIHDPSIEPMKRFVQVEQKFQLAMDNNRFLDRTIELLAPGAGSLFMCAAQKVSADAQKREVDYAAPLSLRGKQMQKADNDALQMYVDILKTSGLTNASGPQLTLFVPALMERARFVADAEYFRMRGAKKLPACEEGENAGQQRARFMQARACGLVQEALHRFPPVQIRENELHPNCVYRHDASQLAKAMDWLGKQRNQAQSISR